MEYREIGKRFMRVNRLRRNMLWRLTGGDDLRFGQLPALEHIIRNEGCSQCGIAEALSVSAPSVAASCKRLEAAGLIERKTDLANRRQNRLYATEQGKALSKNCRIAFDKVDECSFAKLSEEEQTQLASILNKILTHLEEEE